MWSKQSNRPPRGEDSEVRIRTRQIVLPSVSEAFRKVDSKRSALETHPVYLLQSGGDVPAHNDA
jgi:hypothetical protein